MDHGAFSKENAFLFGPDVLSMRGKDFLFIQERNL